ncbi:MAG: InlB B-repeat-containing protein, partial [Eubacterium sp.]|nr:InlB B-repeat-containing protein [Eubacterium sp.]
TTSGTSLNVTHILYQNFYDYDNGLYSKDAYIIGSVALETPVRPGYQFDGWLRDETPVTAADITDGSEVILTAKWTRSAYAIETQPQSVSAEYDGQEKILTAAVGDDVVGNVNWTWYKVGAGEAGADLAIAGGEGKDTSLNVKNVSDSGTYYAVATVTLNDGEESRVDIISEEATVDITRKALTITAENIDDLVFGDSAPAEYAYSYEGLVDGEEAVLNGTFTSAYTSDSPAGTYDITEDPDKRFEADNYAITIITGTLTVLTKEVRSSVEVALADENDAVVEYNGNFYEPAVTVRDNGEDIGSENYTVIYSDNKNAGTATVTVEFKKNYSGEKKISFEISKARAEAVVVFEETGDDGTNLVTSWIYGTAASYSATQNGVQIKTNTTSDSSDITYHYLDSENNDITAGGIPKAAGTYKVYVEIPETGNYLATATEPVVFTIDKRPLDIMITGGYTCAFNGEEHRFTEGDYKRVNGTSFAPGEEFSDVEILGSRTDVGTVPGEFTYTALHGMDVDNNYIISIIPDDENNGDKIIITPQQLDKVSGLKWSKEVNEIGTAEWNGVSRGDMVSTYTVKLYRKAENPEEDELVSTVNADTVSHDFADVIRNDIAAMNAGSDNKKAYDYYFTVSVGAKENGNYAESELASGRDTAVMHTALLYNDEQEGIKDISMGENSDGYIILLQGETVNVSVKTEDGYTNPYTWSDVDVLTVNKPNAVSTSVTLGDSISASYDRIVLSSRAEDEAPVIEVFTGETSADGQKVYIGFTASDSRNLSKWMISAGSTAPGENDPAWTDIASSDITSDGESGRVKLLYDKTRTDVTSQGEKTYYAYIMDSVGNITRSEPLHIYVISFNKGNADSTCTGTMNSIFKVEDVPVTLPELKYVYPGYSFVNWKTSATTYMDQAVYADNASDTLTAVWTDRLYKYKVEYYLQDINGEYPATATRSNTFNTAYGTTVGPETNMILLHDEGFTMDSSNSESKLIDADNIVVKLYYTRNKYNLKYILTMPDDTVDEKVTQVYYGAPVTEREKTEIAGYTFIGWKYSDAGTRPATMPAHDVTATAYYKAGAGAYRINYYIQDVDDNKSTTYNLYSSETIESEQDSIIDASIDNVSDIEGFTCVGHHSVYDNNPVAGYVTVSSENMAAYADERDPSVSAVTTLNINYYFDRNVYTLTFDLWNNEERTKKVYTNSWQVKYGTPINPADYINDNAENWDKRARDVGVDTENYRVTEVSSWSTGLVAPATMPVGDVTVFRQYIPNLRDKFRVKLYLQLADGTYPEDPDKSIVYEGTLNEKVHVGSGTTYDVNTDEFEYYIPYYQYAYSVDEELSDMSGTVVDTSENDMLELKLYLKRTVITAKINYIYKDINGTETTFATTERSGLWSEISDTGNKFSYDPFLYFYGTDSSPASEEMMAGLISGRTVNGVSPIEYDFNRTIKNDAEYVCSVSVSEVCNYRWDTKTYSNVTRNESGDFGTPKGYGRTNNDCRVNVYYSEIDVTKSFYFDFEMNKSVDDKYLTGEAKTVPITYNFGDGERTYKLREANLSDLVGTDFSYGDEDPDYYAANDLKRGSSVTGEVKDGFQKVEIGGRDYYITTDADDNGDYYIYIPNPANSYYPGHYCSASYNSTDVQQDIPFVTKWLDSYKTRNADESLDGRDTMAAALYVYNRSSTVINSVGSDGSVPNRKVTVNFAYGDTYNLNMNLLQTSGQTINAQARYVKGSNISYKNIMDNIAAQNFAERSGYEIKWYLDSTFTEPLMLEEGESSSKAVFSNIAGDKYIYGRYEKERLIHHLYIYYMTSDASMPYVTIDDVSDDQGVKEGYTKTSETKQVVFQNEEGKDVQITVKNDTYSKDGHVVLKDMQVPGVTYTELILTNEDIEQFLKEGFYYDESNPDNKTYAYCEHSPVKFHIYYARNKHNLKIDNKYDKDNVVSSYIKRSGYTVEVQDPEKPGYIFKNWDVKKIVETDDGEGNITETHEDLGYDVTISDPDDSGIRTFEMPDDNIILEAVWEETAFDTTMKHFFQTEDQSYMTMLAGDIAGVTGTPVTVDGYGSAQKYTVNGTDIIGVLTSFSGKEYRLYFTT